MSIFQGYKFSRKDRYRISWTSLLTTPTRSKDINIHGSVSRFLTAINGCKCTHASVCVYGNGYMCTPLQVFSSRQRPSLRLPPFAAFALE